MTSSTATSASSTSLPTPFSFAPSQYWDGNDGSWSSFVVRIGSPSQDFRVFPSTFGQETLIPVPEGCTDDDPSNCGSLRGVMPFQGAQGTGFLTNESSTWNYIGLYTTDLENNLGIDANGLYGFDTVGLQIENSGGIEQTNQVVAGIADKSFMYGIFGLGPRPSNFSVFSDPQPSFLTTLRDNDTIPSKSYGYTAGASYQNSGVLASLTLGGYDTSRFDTSTQLSFPFASDDSRPLQAALTQILASQSLTGPQTLTSTGYFAMIDSTVPHIWMPRSACDNFASAFGLNYDNVTDLYLVNDTMHEKLISLNPTVIFTLSPSSSQGGESTTISLPYAAFDLEASYPYYENATRYFPIRRAANDTQYILGRTFLQEAYLTADYERNNFSLAQAVFSNPMPDEQIVSILPPGYNSTNSTGTNSTIPAATAGNDSPILSRNVIIGIAVGAVGGAALVLFIGFFFWHIRRRRRKQGTAIPTIEPATPSPPFFAEADTGPEKLELSGDSEAAINELPSNEKWHGYRQELHGSGALATSRSEMFVTPPELDGQSKRMDHSVFELEGSEVEMQRALRDAESRSGGHGRRKFSFEQ